MRKFNDYMRSLGVKKMYFVALIAAIGLLIAGFVCPPLAVIDRSVLIAVAEIIIMVDLPIVIAIVATHEMSVWYDADDKRFGITSQKEDKEDEDN